MINSYCDQNQYSLLEEIEQVRKDCREAQMMLNFADADFIDQAVFRINMANSQLDALLRLAKKQGLQAWTEPIDKNKPNKKAGAWRGLLKSPCAVSTWIAQTRKKDLRSVAK